MSKTLSKMSPPQPQPLERVNFPKYFLCYVISMLHQTLAQFMPIEANFLSMNVLGGWGVMPIGGLPSIPTGAFHKIECTICIMFVAIIPAILIFTILKKGATIKPLQAGSFTVLAASSLGYLILRFSEANDAISHLLIWHYLPMICFAILGAVIGKFFLKW